VKVEIEWSTVASISKRSEERALGRLRWGLRRLARWYAVVCARDDAHRWGFVVPDTLPLRTGLRNG
jgi:hypothetical protein